MDDPFPQTGRSTKGPRCDFCGRTQADTDGEMVSGHGVHICSSCISDAIRMVDGDVASEKQDAEPTPTDFEAAYVILKELSPPLRDLVTSIHDEGTELYAVASDVRFYRTSMGMDLVVAMDNAMKFAISISLESKGRIH